MAKTTLRAYNREIETMLDRGQADEVVAHCHHILKTYPKNLETYRLLGKAYLEMKKFNDAVDIFTRVLVCVPNDFVSQVGMSIIRDEGNKLDDAIWHMERAFESQPSNAAVQSELQRLYGRRDGVQPPRIRMTRGALAHMYVKGELYPQAISEIKSVLKEDPGRTDMQVLLARAHFRSGQKSEAAEAASSLLRRYPYCLDANAVLVELLGADKPESVQANRQRVVELDPYAAHVTGAMLQTIEAPDSAVTIEKLDWSGQPVSISADWRETRGISLQGGSEEEPDWLKTGLAQTETAPPIAGMAVSAMDAPASAPAEANIPDFLRDAGWGKSTGAFDESKSSMDEDDSLPPTHAAPLAAGDMPDWIKAMAPSESETPAADEVMPDWMNRIDPGILPSTPEPVASSEQPDWLKPLETSAPVAASTEMPSGQPEWFKGLGEPEAQPAVTDQPDWLKGLGDEAAPAESVPVTSRLDFLTENTEQPKQSQSAAPVDTSGLSAQAEDDAFAWLESLAVKQGSTEGLLIKPEDRLAEEPDWVKQAKSLTGEPEAPAPPMAQPVMEEFPSVPAGNLEELGKSEKEQDDSFSWLENLAAKQGATEGLLIKAEERKQQEPDWVKQAKEISEVLPPTQELPKQPESPVDTAMWLRSLDAESPASEPVRQSSSDETAMWLKSLDEPESPAVVEPAQRGDLPDWMQTLDLGAPVAVEESAIPAREASELVAPSASQGETSDEEPRRLDTGTLPGWLQGLDAEAPKTSARDDLPAWLRDETGELVAEPTKIEPTRAADWQTIESRGAQSVEAPPPKPQPAPKPAPQKPAVKKAEAQPAPVAEAHREPAVRKPAGSMTADEDPILGTARGELSRSNIPGALVTYAKLIKRGRFLDEVIFDLREALYRYPVEVSIWQSLGDAYMRANRLQDALDAYTKAEELLR